MEQVEFVLATANIRFEFEQHLKEEYQQHRFSMLVINEELDNPQPILFVEVVDVKWRHRLCGELEELYVELAGDESNETRT